MKLLDLYCSKLPLSSKYFYMRPLAKVPADNGKAWYTRQRVEINKLKKLLPNMCKDAGTKVRYTNHSLRATAMMRMYNQRVPEKLIAEKSGHRSIEALRMYEHTTPELQRAASEVISDPRKSFPTLMDKQEPVKVSPTLPAAPTLPAVSPSLPGFSGLNNCTIHFSFNYGRKE